MMSEKRFILCQDDLGNYEIRYDDKVFHFLCEVAPILNEQQCIIQELERKVKKYAKIGEGQLKQIIELQEENRELRQSVEYWQKKYEEGTETFQIN